jgi:hypothetical protein
MRAPATLDSIVASIVADLRPPAADEYDRLSADTDIRGTIQLLQTLDRPTSYRGKIQNIPWPRGKRQENIDDFTALLKQVKHMEKTLAGMTGPALFTAFSGETDLHSDGIPSDEVQRRTINRLQFFKSALVLLRQRCQFLLKERPGEHGNTKFRQHRVAYEAWRLLRRFEKVPADGSADSLYGRVTSKLWEALTGEASKDLQWACKVTLQLADEGELRDS